MRFLLFIAPLFLLILPSPLSSTPFHAHDGSLSESRVIREELFVPARHTNTTIESHLDPAPLGLALSVVSGDGTGENSAKSTIEEENLSLDELEKQSNEATVKISTWTNRVDTDRGYLDKKIEEAKGPNQDYANKKEEWERLKKISDVIAAEWNEKLANDTRFVKDFEALERDWLQNNQTNQENLDTLALKEQAVITAQASLDELKGIPDKIKNLNDQITAMDNGKQALIDLVKNLGDAVEAANTILDEKKRLQVLTEEEIRKATCDLTPAASICTRATGERQKDETAIRLANETLKTATDKLEGPATLLHTFDKRKKALQNKINSLEIPSADEILVEERKVNRTKKQVDIWNLKVNETSTKAANLTLELTQKRHEYEKSKLITTSPPPDEIGEAIKRKDLAWMALDKANSTKTKFDIAVQELQTELQNSLNSLEEAKLKAEALTKRYEAAKRKAEPPKGFSEAMLGGIAAGTCVLSLLLIAVLVVCYKRNAGCLARKKSRNCKSNAVSTRTTTYTSTPSMIERRTPSAQTRTPDDQLSARPVPERAPPKPTVVDKTTVDKSASVRRQGTTTASEKETEKEEKPPAGTEEDTLHADSLENSRADSSTKTEKTEQTGRRNRTRTNKKGTDSGSMIGRKKGLFGKKFSTIKRPDSQTGSVKRKD